MKTNLDHIKNLATQQKKFLSSLILAMPQLSLDQLNFLNDIGSRELMQNILHQLGVEYWKPLWNKYYAQRWDERLDWSTIKTNYQPGGMTELLIVHPCVTLSALIEKINCAPTNDVIWNVNNQEEYILRRYNAVRSAVYTVWHESEPRVFDTFYGEEKTLENIRKVAGPAMNVLELILFNDFMRTVGLVKGTNSLNASFLDEGGIMTLGSNDFYSGGQVLVTCKNPEYKNPDILITLCDFERLTNEKRKCLVNVKSVVRVI